MRIRYILFILFYTTIGIITNAQETNPYKIRKDAIDKILVTINSKTPIRLDNVSEQIGAEYDEEKNIFSYKIRCIDRVVENIDIKLFNQVFTKHININSQKEPLTQALLQAKVIIEYRFYDMNKKYITGLKLYPPKNKQL